MVAPKNNYQQFLHTPASAVSQALTEFERKQNALYRLEWGVESLDNYLIPMMDGDLVSLISRPGHGKTSSMIHLAKRGSKACHELAEQGTGFDRIVVYVTYETTIEEFIGLLSAQESGQTLEMIARGRANLKKIRDVAIHNIGNRIYIIGKSSIKPSGIPITLQIVDYLLRDLREEGKRPLLILLDYLQRIPGRETRLTKPQRVEDNTELAKDLALNHGCPLVMGVQASRETDDVSGIKLPTMNMAQWSSAIEQTTDKLIAQTRPVLYSDEGSVLKRADPDGNLVDVPITNNMMVYKVLKQRWGRAGETFLAHFNPALIQLGDFTFQDEAF